MNLLAAGYNKIYLSSTDTAIQDPENQVSYLLRSDLICNDTGTAIVNDADGNPIQNISDDSGTSIVAWDSDAKKWYAEFTLPTTQRAALYRLCWTVKTAAGALIQMPYEVANYDMEILAPCGTGDELLITPQWFIDNFEFQFAFAGIDLEKIEEAETALEAAKSILRQDPATMDNFYGTARSYIEAAMNGLSLTPRTETVRAHFKAKPGSSYIPIHTKRHMVSDVSQVSLYFGDNRLHDWSLDYVLIQENSSIVNLYHYVVENFNTQSITASYLLPHLAYPFGVTGASQKPSHYEPNAIQITLTHGLDWCNLSEGEKDAWRWALGAQVFLYLLPLSDVWPGIGSQSYSSSRKGVSQSSSVAYTASAMYGIFSAALKAVQDQLDLFLKQKAREYGTDLIFGVV